VASALVEEVAIVDGAVAIIDGTRALVEEVAIVDGSAAIVDGSTAIDDVASAPAVAAV
jgi:hypothetical protein